MVRLLRELFLKLTCRRYHASGTKLETIFVDTTFVQASWRRPVLASVLGMEVVGFMGISPSRGSLDIPPPPPPPPNSHPCARGVTLSLKLDAHGGLAGEHRQTFISRNTASTVG